MLLIITFCIGSGIIIILCEIFIAKSINKITRPINNTIDRLSKLLKAIYKRNVKLLADETNTWYSVK